MHPRLQGGAHSFGVMLVSLKMVIAGLLLIILLSSLVIFASSKFNSEDFRLNTGVIETLGGRVCCNREAHPCISSSVKLVVSINF